MNVRTQVNIDPEMQRRAQARAAELGVSFAEYVRRLLTLDLGESKRKIDISVVFDLVSDGPKTQIARDKDKMIAEAVWHEHVRRSDQKQKTRTRLKITRR
jgi:hypothetical protein